MKRIAVWCFGVLILQLVFACKEQEQKPSATPTSPSIYNKNIVDSPLYRRMTEKGDVIDQLKKQLYSTNKDDRNIAMANLAITLDPRACRVLINYLLEQEKKMPVDGLEKYKDNPKITEQMNQIMLIIAPSLKWLSLMNLPEGNKAVKEYLKRFEERYGSEELGRYRLEGLKKGIEHFIKDREMRLQDWIYPSQH
jgi:hypothetical protein